MCHLPFWHNDWDLLHATGVEWIPKYESAQKVGPGEENFPAVHAEIRTRNLSVMCLAL